MKSDPFINRLLSTVVDILHEKRVALDISKKWLAEKSGVTRTAILLMERHERSPSLELLLRLARAMNISLADVIKEAENRCRK